MTFDYQPHLVGDLIAMRPVTAADFEPLFAVASDPQVWALHPRSDRYKSDVFRAYFDDGLASGGALVALDRATGAVAGWSRYSEEFALPGEIEIGWTFLGRAYWGGPHNSEMKRLMLDHAFGRFAQVIFRIGENNLRSRRAVEKLGATLTDRTQIDGAVTHLFYAISRENWRG